MTPLIFLVGGLTLIILSTSIVRLREHLAQLERENANLRGENAALHARLAREAQDGRWRAIRLEGALLRGRRLKGQLAHAERLLDELKGLVGDARWN